MAGLEPWFEMWAAELDAAALIECPDEDVEAYWLLCASVCPLGLPAFAVVDNDRRAALARRSGLILAVDMLAGVSCTQA